jgi:hypothetical protein
MKRPGANRRVKPSPARARPELSLLRRLFEGAGLSLIARILLAAICLYAMVSVFAGSDAEIIDLNSSNYQYWELRGVQRVERGSESTSIECDQPCLVISPSLSYSVIDAANHPYAKIVFDPASSIQECHILLSNRSNPGSFFPRPVLMERNHVFCDLRDSQKWNSIQPFESTIERIGISFTGRLLLKRIELTNYLSLRDYARLLFANLTSVEPAAPYAINGLYGIRLFGQNQIIAAFGLLFVLSLLILSFGRTGFLRKIFIGLALVMLFVYLPCFICLYDQLEISIKHSSLKYDLFDEQASCFGEEYASLSRALHEKVPRGSRVFCVSQNIDSYKTESNLAEFVHRVRYEPRAFGDADYFVCYRWPGIYDPKSGILTDPKSAKKLAVKLIHEQGDSFIAKVLK